MYNNWDYQNDNVKVSGNYLEHTRNGYGRTNAERFGVNPNAGRTDFLLNNGDGTHSHISVDDRGNFTNWGENHPHNKW